MATNTNGITGRFDKGTSGGDVLYAASGGSVIYGYAGNDTFFGAGGNDWFTGGLGADYFFGAAGYDAVDYSDSATGVMVGIGMGGLGGTAEGDYVGNDIEAIWASEYSDFLFGSAQGDELYGNGGHDQLFGGAGDDHIEGGAGNDVMNGGSGADYMSGGYGFDTVSYADSSVGVSVGIEHSDGRPVINTGGAAGDLITGTVEALHGSRFADHLAGNDSNNTLIGADGDDTLFGWDGSDELEGGAGGDHLVGGAGVDTVVYARSNAGVFVDLHGGYAAGGEAEGDFLSSSNENVEGSAHRDVVKGNAAANHLYLNGGNDTAAGYAGDDTIEGGDGDDFIMGDQGRDYLFGQNGNDTLLGGDGDDKITGGAGNDRMTGGDGADQFGFLHADMGQGFVDTIVDFSRLQGDRISLTNIDANTNLGGNQGFTFIGTAAFTHQAGQLHYANDGFQTTLSGDVNGDAIADFTVVLLGAPGLSATDFLL